MENLADQRTRVLTGGGEHSATTSAHLDMKIIIRLPLSGRSLVADRSARARARECSGCTFILHPGKRSESPPQRCQLMVPTTRSRVCAREHTVSKKAYRHEKLVEKRPRSRERLWITASRTAI